MFDNAFFDNIDEVWSGFQLTLWLVLFAGFFATVIGTLMASFRVSPIGSLRAVGTSYVNIMRNTPLVLVLVLFSALIPTLGWNSLDVNLGFKQFGHFQVVACIGLSLYTAAFICEALRSGINSVPAGQAEAARSVGMPFAQSLQLVVLPQAFRAVIPPLASIFIALAKNTSVVAVVGVPEASYTMYRLGNKFTSDIYFIFLGFALGYVVIVLAISGIATLLERRFAVVR